MNVHSHQLSLMLMLLLATCVLGPTAIALAYVWATRTVSFDVEEPLSITGYPSALNTKPGENSTLHLNVNNNAYVNYSITLDFILDDAVYQQTYVSFSNTTYTVYPGSNSITAWYAVTDQAPPMHVSLTIEFHRE